MKHVNIMVGRFQPFTKGHLKCVENAYKKFGIPTMVVMIDTPTSKVDKKHPFSTDIIMPIYKDMLGSNKMIEGIVLSKNANIVTIGESLWDMGYVIKSWTCGTDRIEAYSKMSSKYKEEARLPHDFEMIEIERSEEDVSATRVREAMLDNDYNTFIDLIPEPKLPLMDYYNILRMELNRVYEKI